ncbi:hypothetical protein BBG47_20900 [Paenibacillus sp. KS1]|uniref:AMP-binding protein n=1 Tax=Paenibacillus sp. KS1 TaxID=1849249 RepID=UPI0008064900|nr:AMP-binding protein [Paenibacillus sp. KS1]OBY77626.1 hypothetical protein BBG47_20900 [Paenibacillus sp. KS1]
MRRYGVGEDSVVGVMMESSFELIIGILGILKAGAAYVPIDTTYPQDRIHYLMQHAECVVVLTKGA